MKVNRLRMPSPAQLSAIKLAVFLLCLVPAVELALGWQREALGANPIETIARASGEWTLRFLLITLCVTPLRRLTSLHWLLRLRRMLGLFAFAYGAAHFMTYLWLDQFFDWPAIAADIVKRPFITVGFSAFVLLIPLAATSTNRMVKRLGARRWQLLHRLVYAIAVLGVVHYWWLVKKDITEPVIFAALLTILLGARLVWRARKPASLPPATRAQSA